MTTATATATAPKPTAAPPTSADRPAAPLPDVDAHPAVIAAAAAIGRVQGEQLRLEKELADVQARAAEAREHRQTAARRLLDGADFEAVRFRPTDAVEARVRADLRTAKEAVDLARADLGAARKHAADELAKEYAPHYRHLVRRAAFAWLEWARVAAELEETTRQLGEVHGRAGIQNPLPACHAGDPTRMDSYSAVVLRDLVDGGFIHPGRDAEHLAGAAIMPPAPPSPPPPPPKRKPTPAEEAGLFRRALRSLGVPGVAGGD